jgi:type VI protein secretion system component VasK
MNEHDQEFEAVDRDPRITMALRQAVRPPADPAYWDALERRILTGIATETGRALRTPSGSAIIPSWWSSYSRWQRVGSMAAAAVLVIAAYGIWHAASQRDRMAFEATVEAVATPMDSLGRPLSDAPAEKTVIDLFRY